MRKLRLLLFLFMLSLWFATSDSFAQDRLELIKERGIIKIGVSLGAVPIGFRDNRNKPAGYSVELAHAVANKLGVRAKLIDVHGDARISMLISGQIDLAIANLTITESRAEAIDFSIPYLKTGLRIIVQGGHDIQDVKQLAGKSIVVGRGSSGEIYIRENVPDAKLVYTDRFAPNGLLLLKQGRVFAAIEDNTIIDYLALSEPYLELVPGIISSGPIGIGIAKGNPALRSWVNTHINEYIKSGAYEASFKKWWGTSIEPPVL